MKPFITDALVNGRYILKYQIEGLNFSDIEPLFVGSKIVGYIFPKNQSLTTAWDFKLLFDNGKSIQFSSACTNVGGWDEMGSLNMSFSNYVSNEYLDTNIYQKNEISFSVTEIEKLIYESKNVYSEAGIIFVSNIGEEIIIAASVSPGSISVSTPFSEANFEPELSLDDYKRVTLNNL